MRLWNRLGGQLADRDAGQVPIALVVVVFVGLVIVIFKFGFPLGQATDQKAGSQAAADAAALAAAKQITEDLPRRVDEAIRAADDRDDLENLLSFVTGGYGREDAVEFATVNGSDVDTYQYDRFSGQIRVSVLSRATTANQRSQSDAVADVGLRLDDCRLDDDELPPPDPDGAPVEEPPSVGTQLICGDLVLHFTIENGRPSLDSSLDDLENQFRVRLTA